MWCFAILLARETNLAAVAHVARQFIVVLEARGEIRGGRFVNGFVGEQFALSEALDKLRAGRRQAQVQRPVLVSAADPLNLLGIFTADDGFRPIPIR